MPVLVASLTASISLSYLGLNEQVQAQSMILPETHYIIVIINTLIRKASRVEFHSQRPVLRAHFSHQKLWNMISNKLFQQPFVFILVNLLNRSVFVGVETILILKKLKLFATGLIKMYWIGGLVQVICREHFFWQISVSTLLHNKIPYN